MSVPHDHDRSRGRRWWGAILPLVLLIAPVAQARTAVDVELVLAVDTSRSMDRDEQLLQRQGYVEALRDPGVLAAIRGGFVGRIALAYVEWGGAREQRVVVPWQVVEDRTDIERFAARLAAAATERRRYTSISAVLAFVARMIETNDFEGVRRVIDVSGDGPNNVGPPVERIRDALVAKGYVINGLPLMLRPYTSGVNNILLDLDKYYEACVIGGPGSFLITVEDVAELREAIRRKLILEIAGPVARYTRAEYLPGPIDCLIGEKTRPDWMSDPP